MVDTSHARTGQPAGPARGRGGGYITKPQGINCSAFPSLGYFRFGRVVYPYTRQLYNALVGAPRVWAVQSHSVCVPCPGHPSGASISIYNALFTQTRRGRRAHTYPK